MHNLDSHPVQSLLASGPAPDRAEKMSLYGWLVGAWTGGSKAMPTAGSRPLMSTRSGVLRRPETKSQFNY